MGQKTHPKAFRLGVIEGWNSKWFSRKQYANWVRQDVSIRRHILTKLREGGIAKIEIERSPTAVTINLSTSKPGVVIGRGGSGAEALRREIQRLILRNPKVTIKLNILEVRQPELEAQIVVQNLVAQIEKRLPFRRVMRQGVDQVMRSGAQGIKVMLAGRLSGSEYARTEHLTRGKLPLQTLRANVDYARGTARTNYGTIGVKVWIYKGEVFEKDQRDELLSR